MEHITRRCPRVHAKAVPLVVHEITFFKPEATSMLIFLLITSLVDVTSNLTRFLETHFAWQDRRTVRSEQQEFNVEFVALDINIQQGYMISINLIIVV